MQIILQPAVIVKEELEIIYKGLIGNLDIFGKILVFYKLKPKQL